MNLYNYSSKLNDDLTSILIYFTMFNDEIKYLRNFVKYYKITYCFFFLKNLINLFCYSKFGSEGLVLDHIIVKTNNKIKSNNKNTENA